MRWSREALGRPPSGAMGQERTMAGQATAVLGPSERQTKGRETLEYPSSDGKPLAEDNRQFVSITDTAETLQEHFRERADGHVRGDMFIYYDKLYAGMRPEQVSIVPDVFVVVCALEVPQSSYKIWEGGIVPQFVMEVASHSTHRRDRDEKYRIYERLGFWEYWWFDPTGELQRPEDAGKRLLGWRLRPDGMYQPLVAATGESLRSQELELDLCVIEGELRFWDFKQQQLLSNRAEMTEARKAAEQRAETERQRTAVAERRAETAELEASRLKELLAKLEVKPGGAS